MSVATTISITEGRKRLFDIAEEVQIPGRHYTFTDKGRPKTVMISADEYETLIETLEVMRDFPQISTDIKEIKADIKNGKYKNYLNWEETYKGIKDKNSRVVKQKSRVRN